MKMKRQQLTRNREYAQRGFLQVDLLAALAIFAIGITPLAYSFARERQVLKIEYLRSVADEIVDGEMEILVAGAGRDFPEGSQIYQVNSRGAAALPPGHFELVKTGKHLRLEWLPDERRGLGPVIRDTTLP
jgi:hypothetical protein